MCAVIASKHAKPELELGPPGVAATLRAAFTSGIQHV
jgi:hypothetical protein